MLSHIEKRFASPGAIGKNHITFITLGDKRHDVIDQATLLPDAQTLVIKGNSAWSIW